MLVVLNSVAPLKAAQYISTFETGGVGSGLDRPPVYSFAEDGGSIINDLSDPNYDAAIHSITVVSDENARSGSKVLKFEATSDSNRNELAYIGGEYAFDENDEHYFAASYRPDDSWANPALYSIIISQWKMYGGGPHAALRLSNAGDYRLTFHGQAAGNEVVDLGIMGAGEWTDVKVYFKNSLMGDGLTMIWVNGELVYERSGQNVLRSGGGYAKIGLYTEIREDRTLYMDDVEISSSISGSVADWGSSSVVAVPESSTSALSMLGLICAFNRRQR